MTTKQELIEWADITGISIGRDEGSPYPTLEQLAQFAALACAQPPAPEQQVPQGLKLVGLFSFDADGESNLCFHEGTDFSGKDRWPDDLCRLLEEETTCGPQKALYAYSAQTCHAAPEAAKPVRCEYCDGTGDVHSPTGEWRGQCTQCDALKPDTERAEYHCIGYVDGYDTQIKDKDAKMKSPRAVYVRGAA